MSSNTSYEISAPDVVAEDFGAEIVVLNLANGKYFSLVNVAADLWRDIISGHIPQEIVDFLVPAQRNAAEAVQLFVSSLVQEALIRPVQREQAAIPADTASAMMALSQGSMVPGLESFDDMAELILSDPIHDVDEDVGWPVMRDPD